MPFCFNLKISPSCQTLSKTLDMSKKTILTFNPLSKDIELSWVIDSSWLVQELPGRKRNWFLEMSLLVQKQLNLSLKISLSNIYHKSEVKKLADNFQYFVCHFLWMGTIFPFFHSEGNIPVIRPCLKIISSGTQIESPHILSMRILMLSWPWALFESRF